jgi:two-component system nitrate/nitrite response regulator NarL
MPRVAHGGKGSPIRVLIVDDQRLFAEAIQVTLRGVGADVVGVATNGEEALDGVREHRPDVVLLDIGLPDQSGIAVGRRILDEHPDTKVVALTALEDEQVVKEALRVGFDGFLSKDIHVDRFGRAIHAVVDGQVVVPRKIGKSVLGGRDGAASETELLARQLTPRELEVLAHLAEGASSRQIAAALAVSPNTVRTHVNGILSKLQVHSRLEAAAFAVRHGLVRTGP